MKLRLAIFLGIVSLFLIARTCPAPTMGTAISAGDGITITNAAIINADKGTTAVIGTSGKIPMFTATNVVGDTTLTDTQNRTRCISFTIPDPSTLTDTTYCFKPVLKTAITITDLEVTCDTNPDTEIAGDIVYADSFIGKANPTVINDFDTTAGARSDSSITVGAVPTGKCIYVLFDILPISAIKSVTFNIYYTVN